MNYFELKMEKIAIELDKPKRRKKSNVTNGTSDEFVNLSLIESKMQIVENHKSLNNDSKQQTESNFQNAIYELLNRLNVQLFAFLETPKSEQFDEVFKILSASIKLFGDMKKIVFEDNHPTATEDFSINEKLINDARSIKLLDELMQRIAKMK